MSAKKPVLRFYATPLSNPSRGNAVIEFGIPRKEKVEIRIYDLTGRLAAEPINDVSGRLIKTLDEGIKEKGWYEFVWNGKGISGRPLPPGIYFIRFSSRTYTHIIKICHVR